MKPDNAMVGENGQVKLLDFGLAKLTEPAEPDEAPTRDKMSSLTLLPSLRTVARCPSNAW